MAVHTEIVPSGDPALGIGLEALRLARMRMTSNAGSSYWPMGDGTGILAGQQAGDQGLVLVDQHGNRMPLIDTTEISQKADDAMSKANAAVDGMEQVREDAENGVKEAKDAASTAQSTAASAASKADKLATELDGTKAIVERHTTRLGEVETKVSNSVEHADQALSASTQAMQTANSVKTTADRAYDDARSALTQSSTAVQTAGEVKTTLETNYLSKKDSDAAYASKSELKQTSDGITSTVEKTYATKSALEALRNIADNAVETWTGSQKPTASSAPASTWATDQLRKQHAGDVYYDLTSGYSYRWGSTDGKTYAWSLIKDSDITKAIADAAKAQSTANGAQQGVDRLDADIPVTYSTKSELRQTSESLTAKVTEAQRVGQSALDKASTVEQTADGLKATVSEQARTIEGQTTTIGQLTAKADSLTSSLTQTNRNVNIALANSAELIRNPECNSTLGNPDGWDGGMTLSASGAPEGAPVPTYGKFSARDTTTSFRVLRRGRTYRFSAWMAHDSTAKKPAALGCFYHESNGNGRWDAAFRVPTSQSGWKQWSGDLTIPKDAREDAIVWLQIAGALNTAEVTGWYCTLLSIRDVTEAKNAQDTADTAISRASTLEQSLNGFKTTVSQNYETKSDSLAKQSALEQSLNSFKSTVSSTYSTKNELDGLSAMASKTWSFWKDASTSPRRDWVRLGTLTSNGDSSSVQIDVLTGDGWNGGAWQNSRLSIMVKDSWQSSPSTSGAFGVSVLRENCQNAQVRVMALAADECEIWCYLPWRWGSGQYTISGSYKAWSNNTASQSDAPTSGTSQDVAYRLNAEQLRSDVESTYATKSSVEQTATSIKSSVSETYATKTTVQNLSTTLTQTKESLTVSIKQAQTTADTANGNAANAQSRVGSLEACISMTSSGVRVGQIKNGSFIGYSALVSTSGSFQVIDGNGNKVSELDRGGVFSYVNGRIAWTIREEGETVMFDSNASPLKLESADLFVPRYPKYSSNNHLACPVSGQFKGATNVNGVAVITHNLGYIPTLSITPGPWDGIGEPQGKLFRPVIWDCTTTTAQIRFVRTDTNQWIDRQPVAFHWYAI